MSARTVGFLRFVLAALALGATVVWMNACGGATSPQQPDTKDDEDAAPKPERRASVIVDIPKGSDFVTARGESGEITLAAPVKLVPLSQDDVEGVVSGTPVQPSVVTDLSRDDAEGSVVFEQIAAGDYLIKVPGRRVEIPSHVAVQAGETATTSLRLAEDESLHLRFLWHDFFPMVAPHFTLLREVEQHNGSTRLDAFFEGRADIRGRALVTTDAEHILVRVRKDGNNYERWITQRPHAGEDRPVVLPRPGSGVRGRAVEVGVRSETPNPLLEELALFLDRGEHDRYVHGEAERYRSFLFRTRLAHGTYRFDWLPEGVFTASTWTTSYVQETGRVGNFDLNETFEVRFEDDDASQVVLVARPWKRDGDRSKATRPFRNQDVAARLTPPQPPRQRDDVAFNVALEALHRDGSAVESRRVWLNPVKGHVLTRYMAPGLDLERPVARNSVPLLITNGTVNITDIPHGSYFVTVPAMRIAPARVTRDRTGFGYTRTLQEAESDDVTLRLMWHDFEPVAEADVEVLVPSRDSRDELETHATRRTDADGYAKVDTLAPRFLVRVETEQGRSERWVTQLGVEDERRLVVLTRPDAEVTGGAARAVLVSVGPVSSMVPWRLLAKRNGEPHVLFESPATFDMVTWDWLPAGRYVVEADEDPDNIQSAMRATFEVPQDATQPVEALMQQSPSKPISIGVSRWEPQVGPVELRVQLITQNGDPVLTRHEHVPSIRKTVVYTAEQLADEQPRELALYGDMPYQVTVVAQEDGRILFSDVLLTVFESFTLPLRY